MVPLLVLVGYYSDNVTFLVYGTPQATCTWDSPGDEHVDHELVSAFAVELVLGGSSNVAVDCVPFSTQQHTSIANLSLFPLLLLPMYMLASKRTYDQNNKGERDKRETNSRT